MINGSKSAKHLKQITIATACISTHKDKQILFFTNTYTATHYNSSCDYHEHYTLHLYL